jgi:hypothetical protein
MQVLLVNGDSGNYSAMIMIKASMDRRMIMMI